MEIRGIRVENRLMPAFVLSLIGGLLMFLVALNFWQDYVEYRRIVAAHYYGPPPGLILFWMGCGIASIASSGFLWMSRKWILPSGVLVTVVSAIYAALVGLMFTAYELPYAFSAGAPRVAPGLIGVLGGTFAIWVAAARSPAGEWTTD